MRLQAPATPAIRPLTSHIGALIEGIDLSAPSDDDIAVIHSALLEHKVVFFRDQQLSDRAHADFAARFGRPQHFAFLPAVDEAVPEVHELAGGGGRSKTGNADIWHSDASFQKTPPLGSILRSVVSPGLGGDTLWADMEGAYEALPSRIQRLLEGLTATHDFTRSASHRGKLPVEEFPPASHPVVRTHPETGRKCLYVNRIFTARIDQLGDAENDALLPYLFDQAREPLFQCRFRWEAGSVAFWDNRCTQHYAVADYTERRVMRRVVIDGDEPR